MASMRGWGVVGVVSKTSSKPAAVAISRIGPVSSRGISGTRRPALAHHGASHHVLCGGIANTRLLCLLHFVMLESFVQAMQ